MLQAQLDAHLKLHGEKWASEDVRKCKLCNKQFVQPALYRLHIREHYRVSGKMIKSFIFKRINDITTIYYYFLYFSSFNIKSYFTFFLKPFLCF